MSRSNINMGWHTLTILGTLSGFLIPCLFHPSYYFHNDVQHYFMPMAHEIGARLESGDWAILSLRSLYSGNLIGEGQFGLFNPVTLALYWLLAKIPELAFGAMVYAGFHTILLALGVAALARCLSISSPISAALAVTATTGAMISYVDAPVWWNAITTNAWLVWCLRNWLNTFRFGTHHLSSIITSVLVITGGWPHGSIALGLTIGVLLLINLRRNDRRGSLQMVGGFAAAILMSLPALVPLVAHVLDGTRSTMPTWNSPNGTSTLDGLLAISWPSFLTSTSLFVQGPLSFPIGYGGWFIVPILIIHRRKLATWFADIRRPSPMALVLVLALAFGLLSLGPTQMGPLRWPVRFIFYYQLGLLLVAGWLIDHCPARTDLHAGKVLTAIWIAAVFLSWQQSPGDLVFHFVFGATGLFGSLLIVAVNSPAGRAFGIIAISLLIHLQIHYGWPYNDNVIPLPSPAFGQYQPAAIDAPNTLILQRRLHSGKDDWRDFPSGNIALWENHPFINGYTPIQPHGLVDLLCFNNRGYVCAEAIKNLFEIDPATGKDTAALLRIGEIRSEAGLLSRQMEKLKAHSGFSVSERLHNNGLRWSRPVANFGGTLSHACADARISGLGSPEITRERLHVFNPSSEPCLLIWAKTAFPGYEATLGSEALKVSPHLNTLVSVEIPAHGDGVLVLQFRPFGWRATLIAFIAGAILMIALRCTRSVPRIARDA